MLVFFLMRKLAEKLMHDDQIADGQTNFCANKKTQILPLREGGEVLS